jgi:uncharacterized protein (TIGR02597 family)
MLPIPARASSWRSLRPLGVALALPLALFSQSVTSVPVGALRVTLVTGSPAAPSLTAFAVPLAQPGVNQGASAGLVANFNADSITVAGAGWTVDSLASPQAPHAIRVICGAAGGLTFLVTGNTADTVQITGTDLTTTGLVKGDRVELLRVDTLRTLFDAIPLVGGTGPESADIVYLGAHTQDGYYFNTGTNQWRRALGRSGDDCSNVVIAPGAVIQVAHIGPAITLTFSGRVPTAPFRTDVAISGNTFTHSGFPIDVTVRDFALQTRVPGWVAGASPELADKLSVRSGGRWVSLFYDGTHWIDASTRAIADQTVIPAGAAIVIRRGGAESGFTNLTRPAPYSP